MEEKESDPICPNCKQSICAANFATHSAFCERNIRVCEICKEPVRIAEEEEHLKEYHERVGCEDCGLPFEKWMLIKHKEVCKRRLVPCGYCEAEFRFDEYSSHLEFCSTKTEKCLICKKYVMLKDKQKHAEFHLSPKKIISKAVNEEIKQNVINEAISMQGVSESRSSEKIEDRYKSCSKSIRVMACQNDNYSDPRGFEEIGACASEPSKEASKHYVQCHICKQSIPWIDFNLHIPNCASEAGKCSRCGEVVPNSDIKEHILKTCKKLTIKSSLGDAFNSGMSSRNEANSLHESSKSAYNCPFCKQTCSKDRILEHIENCSENYWECPLCCERILEKDKAAHQSKTCRILFDSEAEPSYDPPNYTAVKSAPEDNLRISSKNRKNKSKTSVPENNTTILICELCHDEYDAELEEVHLKFCRPLSFNREKGTEVGSKSYAGATKKNLKTPTSQTFNQKEKSAQYCTCLNCDETVLRERMQNHLLVCQKRNKTPCVYCDKEITVKDEEIHLSVCKGFNASLNINQVPDNRNDYRKKNRKPCIYCNEELTVGDEEFHLSVCKRLNASYNINQVPESRKNGVIPKHSKFAQLAKPKTAKCSYCETTLNNDILVYHEKECVHRLIPCEKCCKPIKIIDLETHDCKSGKGKKGKNRAKEVKEEKSDHGFGFKKCIKNIFGYSEPEANDRSKKESNEPAYLPRDYMYPYYIPDSYNSYGYSYMNNDHYFNRKVDDGYNSFANEEITIPCEFCEKLFPESEIILHSTGCDPASAQYVKPPESEDVKESKSSSNKTNPAYLADSGDSGDFFSRRGERNGYTTRFNNDRDIETAIKPGEFLQDKVNMNRTSAPLLNKPDIVKESENSTTSRFSNFQSLWNMDTPDIDNEAVEILPLDLPPEEDSLDKIDDEMEVSSVAQEIAEDKHVESDPEMSDMLNFIHEAPGEKLRSDSFEDLDLLPDRQRCSDLEKNELVAARRNYQKTYELLQESKVSNAKKSQVENLLPNYTAESSVEKTCNFEPAMEFPASSSLSEFERRYKLIMENNNNILQANLATKRSDAEKSGDMDVSKWNKWRNKKED